MRFQRRPRGFRSRHARTFETLESRCVLAANLVISEVVAENDGSLFDQNGRESDWIEIFNSGTESQSLAGLYLSDDADNLTKWQFPNAQLNAGDYLVVFASGEDLRNLNEALHTNFKLNNGGERLTLVDADGMTVLDELEFSEQRSGWSYGIGQRPSEVGYFSTPTPGAMNSAIDFSGLTSGVTFSEERGFYDAAFDLTLETETEDASIIYTIDGSLPVIDDDGTLKNGAVYLSPIRIEQTTTLRALAWKPNFLSAADVTNTYLFLSHVVNQSSSPPNYPESWGRSRADYGMSQIAEDLPLIAGNPDLTEAAAKDVIKNSLLAIPTLSIVMSADDLFDNRAGIYANPSNRGDAWERAASVEYLLPNGDPGFQINAGIQIMGGTSRDLTRNIKQSLRLVFKEEYGPGQLDYQFFPDNPVTSFNTLALRSNSRDNWTSHQYTDTATYIRDEWAKRTAADMGTLATSGQLVHLYLNGMYWGIYNPSERPDAAFLASHTDADQDLIDTVKFCCPQRVVDGDWDDWNELRRLVGRSVEDNATYQLIQGNNPDGTRNPDFDVLIDIDNFIDYVTHGQFMGSEDWPGNYYVARDGGPESEGFQFFTWDNDLAFRREDKVTPERGNNWWTESPGEMDIALRENAEYQIRFADRVQELYFNDGPLTSQASIERWQKIADGAREALIAESARWGDYRRDVLPAGRRMLFTPHENWEANIETVARYFETRPSVVLDQLKRHGLFPDIPAPAFSQHGGLIASGFELSMDSVLGIVYDETPLVASDGPVTAWVPTSEIHDAIVDDAPTWSLSNFDDTSWLQSQGGVGFDKGTGYEEHLGIDLFDPNLPAGKGIDGNRDGTADNSTVYVRYKFNVGADFDASTFDAMFLRVFYDDGFVAYLNGREVLRLNAPEDLLWNSRASGTNEADTVEEFEIGNYLDALVPGQENVLAFHLLNRTVANNDLVIAPELVLAKEGRVDFAPIYFTTDGTDPRLTGGQINTDSARLFGGPISLDETTQFKARTLVDGVWSAMEHATFAVPGIVVTEINYNPHAPNEAEIEAGFLDKDDFEFIELANMGRSNADLSNLQFVQTVVDGETQGIEFDFANSDKKTLASGERLLVVKNADAFAFRYGGNFVIAGQYEGKLSNSGETITLKISDEVIQQFVYQDDWFAATDGGGSTLEIIDATGALASWNEKASWQASDQGGTPGVSARTERMPGDANHDGIFNSADLVLVFVAAEYEDDIDGNSTFEEGDWNGDGDFTSADLVAAFQAGTYVASATKARQQMLEPAVVETLFASTK